MYGITNAGGGSGTKSTLIISIDSGSTVQVYSNSTYTTLVKTATEKSAGQFWVKGLDNGTYYIKATKGSDTARASYTISEYGVYRIAMAYRSVPVFTYSGTYKVVHDDDTTISNVGNYIGDWKIRFLTSGTLNISALCGAADGIDIFAVGGGGGGGGGASAAGSGGGGGYTTNAYNRTIATNTDYIITVGSGGAGGNKTTNGTAGGESSFGNLASALGGNGGISDISGAKGGTGGSGGGSASPTATDNKGGSNGGNGGGGASGQGTTTYEFEDPNSALYAGGGAGSGNFSTNGKGGAGGGGDYNVAGETNKGGGGGAYSSGQAKSGGSGIVIIRNARS